MRSTSISWPDSGETLEIAVSKELGSIINITEVFMEATQFFDVVDPLCKISLLPCPLPYAGHILLAQHWVGQCTLPI